jgi:hypothetical protein
VTGFARTTLAPILLAITTDTPVSGVAVRAGSGPILLGAFALLAAVLIVALLVVAVAWRK